MAQIGGRVRRHAGDEGAAAEDCDDAEGEGGVRTALLLARPSAAEIAARICHAALWLGGRRLAHGAQYLGW